MTRILHRTIGHNYPVAVKGEGIYLIDRDGRRYMDGSCGASITCLGFDNQAVINAVRDQLDRIPFAYTTGFTTEPLEALGEYMVSHAPDGLDYAYFVSGGSEAVEAAIMLARQYFVERGEPQRRYIIGRKNSYHGSTLATLAVGANARSKSYEPLLIDVDHISPCYAYRFKRDVETDEEYGLRVADELEATIIRRGQNEVFAFIAETIIGGNSGAVEPVPGYFRRVREICDKYGILLILDEVMCGLGRSGTYYALEQEGIRADIVTVAKGLAAGYQPIGAVMLGEHIYDAIRAGSGGFEHGHSFLGHATSCAAALATQKLLIEGGILENIKHQSSVLDDALTDRFSNQPYIGNIRGRGLFRGIELVAERSKKGPFDPKLNVSARIREEAMSRGLYIYAKTGCIDGAHGDFVLIAPPFVINQEETHRLVDMLGDAVETVVGQLSAAAF